MIKIAHTYLVREENAVNRIYMFLDMLTLTGHMRLSGIILSYFFLLVAKENHRLYLTMLGESEFGSSPGVYWGSLFGDF